MSGTILPPGKTTFFDANGDPLAAGEVYFYIPNTDTPKNTWQNAALSILNMNPVELDAAGTALIYGTGAYRQLVKDVDGNTIWDQQTNGIDSGTYSTTDTAQTITATKIYAPASGSAINLQDNKLLTLNTADTIGMRYNSSTGNIEFFSGATTRFSISTGATPYPVGAMVSQITPQAIANDTTTPITFGSAVYNNHAIWSAGSPTRLTVPAGVSYVKVYGSVRFAVVTSSGASFVLNIFKNGSTSYMGDPRTVQTGGTAPQNYQMIVSSPPLNVTAGDYFELNAYQASGGGLNTDYSAQPNGTWFAMEILQ